LVALSRTHCQGDDDRIFLDFVLSSGPVLHIFFFVFVFCLWSFFYFSCAAPVTRGGVNHFPSLSLFLDYVAFYIRQVVRKEKKSPPRRGMMIPME